MRDWGSLEIKGNKRSYCADINAMSINHVLQKSLTNNQFATEQLNQRCTNVLHSHSWQPLLSFFGQLLHLCRGNSGSRVYREHVCVLAALQWMVVGWMWCYSIAIDIISLTVSHWMRRRALGNKNIYRQILRLFVHKATRQGMNIMGWLQIHTETEMENRNESSVSWRDDLYCQQEGKELCHELVVSGLRGSQQSRSKCSYGSEIRGSTSSLLYSLRLIFSFCARTCGYGGCGCCRVCGRYGRCCLCRCCRLCRVLVWSRIPLKTRSSFCARVKTP